MEKEFSSTPAGFADFAIDLAMAARAQTVGLSAIGDIEDKGENGTFDPVTSADRSAETAMRQCIEARFPGHGIEGEEFPAKQSTMGLSWSLDPIDGTRSYICGLPVWTTLIALLEDGTPVLGVVDAPRLDEIYLGSGNEAVIIRNGKSSPLSASGCRTLREARFSTTDPFLFGDSLERVQKIVKAVPVTRFGLDAYAYARLAAGTIDLVIEKGLKPHDFNALIPLVRASGGYIGNWDGGSDCAGGSIIAAASAELYEEAVAFLARA